METKSSAVDWPTVLRYLSGGALVGGGLGAATTLFNHLNTLQEQAKRNANPGADENVIYINLRHPGKAPVKMASAANNAPTFALSGLGAMAGMYGAYNLVQNIHQSLRKKELQKELAKSQQIYLDQLGTSNQLRKSANQFSFLTKGIGTGYLAALLTAAGAGVVTNRILQKQFPPLKDPNRDRPKRIVLRSVDAAGQPETPDEVEQPASESPEAVEALVRAHLGNAKTARASGMLDLVSVAAAGGCDLIRDCLKQACADPVDYLFARIDGGHWIKTSAVNRNLAVSWLAHDPLVSSALRPLLAAEFANFSPGIMKMASCLDREDRISADALVGIAVEMAKLARYEALSKVWPSIKQAGEEVPGPLKAVVAVEAIKKLLEGQDDSKLEVANPGNISSSQDSPAPEGVRLSVTDDDAAHFLHKNRNLLENATARY